MLAEKEGLGRVVLCDGCADVHLALENVTMRISCHAFMSLAEMVEEALRHPKFLKTQPNVHLFLGSHLFSCA